MAGQGQVAGQGQGQGRCTVMAGASDRVGTGEMYSCGTSNRDAHNCLPPAMSTLSYGREERPREGRSGGYRGSGRCRRSLNGSLLQASEGEYPCSLDPF